MITLLRALRLWQIKTKWELAVWQQINRQAEELIKNPEEIEKKIVSALAEIIHKENGRNDRKNAENEIGG